MSQEHSECYIKDLPDPSNSLRGTVYRSIYCFCLFMNITNNGPFRLFVTDFTSNPLIANSYVKSHYIEDFEIPIDFIFQVELFKEVWKPFLQDYEVTYGEKLIDMGERPPFRLSKKLILLNLNIQLKTYNGVVEGKARRLRLINELDRGNEHLQRLYVALTQLPRTFFIGNLDRARTILPPNYITRVLNGDTASISLDQKGENNTRPNKRTWNYEPQIKKEAYETEIPDTLFPSDYVNSSEPENEDEKNHYLESVESSFDNAKLVETKWLKENINAPDGKIYKVLCRIVGVVPDDWSHLCSKHYMITQDSMHPILSDPLMSMLELLIRDEAEKETFISGQQLMRVYLDPSDILDSLEYPSIESAYINLAKCNKRKLSNKTHLFKLYLKSKTLESGKEIAFWSAKDVNLKSLFF